MALSVAALAGTPATASAPAVPNPCAGPGARHLLCPDLRVGPATDLWVEHRGNGGSSYYRAARGALLHASNDIRSRGRGPMELRGHRYKRHWMRANQAIYRAGGGVEVFRTDMRFDPNLLRRQMKARTAIHTVAVQQSHGRHLQSLTSSN